VCGPSNPVSSPLAKRLDHLWPVGSQTSRRQAQYERSPPLGRQPGSEDGRGGRRRRRRPDPYYFTSNYDDQDIKFINLPAEAVIRIYSMSGVLVTLLEHHSTTGGGEASWNTKNRTGRHVAPGVYFYHIESGDARRVGRMLVVNARR